MDRTFDRIPGPQHVSERWLTADLVAATPSAFDRVLAARIDALGLRVSKLEKPPFGPPPPSPRPPADVKLWDIPGVVLDQGPEGECVGHGWAHALAAFPKPRNIGPMAMQNKTAEVLYERAQFFDGSPPDEQSGASTGGGAKAAREAGAIAAFTWCKSALEVASAIMLVGPVVIGVNWYEGCMDVDALGFVNVTGAVKGGHEVCLRGWDSVARTFTGRNSWGEAWGRRGDFFLHFDDLVRLLNEGGDACVPVKP